MTSDGFLYLGVDPGESGAMAVINADGRFGDYIKLSSTPRDIWYWINRYAEQIDYAILESVHAMPQQGVSSTFKFGKSFGTCIGLLAASGCRYELVTPQSWQKELSCMTRGDKNVTKNRAQELYPNVKITHAYADAILLAEYARRKIRWTEKL